MNGRFRFPKAGPAAPDLGPIHFRVVRLEEGRDRYTVLPGRFHALVEAQTEIDLLASAYPDKRFVLQLSGLS